MLPRKMKIHNLLQGAFMKTVRRLVTVSCIAAIALLNSAARGQVVKQIPSDALIVVKVNNLLQTSNKIAGLAKQFGVSDMVPQMGDPLGAFEEKTGMSKGLNKEGEFAFAYLNDEAYKPAEAAAGDNKPARPRARRMQPAMLVLIPVANYDEFLTNFTNVKADGDMSTVTLPKAHDTA